MLKTEHLNDFYIKGFTVFSFPEAFKYNFDNFNFIQAGNQSDDFVYKNDPLLIPIINEFAELIEQRYVSFFGSEYKNLRKLGVNLAHNKARKWHSDVDTWADLNICLVFNLYLDDTKEHNNGFDIKNDTEEFNLFPKKGDLFMLNVSNAFKHKANINNDNVNRRVMTFDYFVPSLDKVIQI
jgi:hypothetical protein